MEVLLYTILTLCALGVLAAVVLYFVARKFRVEEDPRIDEVEKMLPGANCPCVQYRSASMRFIDLISRWSGLLKFMATFSTSVNISSVSA